MTSRAAARRSSSPDKLIPGSPARASIALMLTYKKTLAAACLAASAAIIPAVSSGSDSKTIDLTAVRTGNLNTSKTTFVETDNDVIGGKKVGADVVQGSYDPKTKTVKGNVAAALEGGILYLSWEQKGNAKTFDGTVDGGTGDYKGVTGTWTGTNTTKRKTHVVVTYH
jgi:hypothetical protein